MANLRRRLRFELFKTVLIAVRGHRGRYYEKAIPVDELDLNLAHTTNDEDRGDVTGPRSACHSAKSLLMNIIAWPEVPG